MKRSVFVLAAATAIVAGSVIAAQNRGRQGGAPPQPMGFFVTSVGLDGGNLGGLQGADAHCQKLAAASGEAGAGDRVWRAYLSTQGPNAVNARDRIGQGPWANARGGVVARDVAHLHGDTVELAQLGSNLSKTTALTEKNTPVLGAGDMGPEGKPLNQHDILTGSTSGGPRVPGGRRPHLQQLDEQLDGRRRRSVTSIAPAAATRRGTRRTPARAAAGRTSCRPAATATSTASRRNRPLVLVGGIAPDQKWIERGPSPPSLVRIELRDREVQVRRVLRRVARRPDAPSTSPFRTTSTFFQSGA